MKCEATLTDLNGMHLIEGQRDSTSGEGSPSLIRKQNTEYRSQNLEARTPNPTSVQTLFARDEVRVEGLLTLCV
jgi:hypothetical protein